jgi:hypothetical protein
VDIKMVNNIGASTFLYFMTIKTIILLQIIMLVVFALYAIYSNRVASAMYMQ